MSDTIQRVESSWQGLMDAVDGVPEDHWSVPGVVGEWSIKDVLGHVTFWESRAVAAISRTMRGEPDPETPADYDFEPINQEQHSIRAGWSVEAIRNEMNDTHGELMALLHKMPSIDPDRIEGNTFEHYDEHAQEIRNWRTAQGM
jgi:hypothetical protein